MIAAQPIEAVLIGAGDRGKDTYGRYALAHPDEIRFVAVAEPLPERREAFARQHQIRPNRCYPTWEPLLKQPKMGDAALICTQDRLHARPALAALESGYHVLLEKPMAPTAEECKQLVDTAERRGLHLQICHVLRYAPFFQAIHRAIQSGELGELACLSQRENVSYWHMAHSFVRGNWRRRDLGNAMILAKCCHDLDLLQWFAGARARQISSFGSLSHFRSEHAPQGAARRCADNCPIEPDCIYSAIDIYVRLRPLLQVVRMSEARFLKMVVKLLERQPALVEQLARIITPLRQLTEYSGWPVRVVTTDFTRKGRLQAIRDSSNPYGRCVYYCDNDVVDHQHVNIGFENGVTATLIMHGHSYAEGRTVRIDGSKATLIGEMYLHRQRIELFDKQTGRRRILFTEGLRLGNAAHGGGDTGLMSAFVALVRGDWQTAAASDARGALESHLMAFAAEQARTKGKVVEMAALR